MIIRYCTSTVVALLITLGLFFLMQVLIATGKSAVEGSIRGHRVEIGEVRSKTDVQQADRKPQKPKEPEAPPETPDLPQQSTNKPVQQSVEIGMAKVDTSLDVAGTGGFAASDGDYLPIVKVAPVYPRRAAERGIEGYVILEFTVTKQGTVANVVVVESSNSIFNRAASKAAAKFKYKPKVIDGSPVDVDGILHKITFELEK